MATAGVPAGDCGEDGAYPEGALHARAQRALAELVEAARRQARATGRRG